MVRGGPISGGLKRYPHVEEALDVARRNIIARQVNVNYSNYEV